MTHSLACAICCSVPLVFFFSSLLNLGSKTRSCTQQSAGFSRTPPFQRGVPCISGEPVSVALLNCENLSLVDCQTCHALSLPAVRMLFFACCWPCSFFACCWPCSSLPAVGHALLCLLLAMLFFACCLLCSSYVDSSDRLARVIRACCLLSRTGFAVRLLRLYLWAVLQIAMPTLCSSCATDCSLLPARVIRACFLLARIRSSG